jgi:hypothetical protein
MDRSILCRDGPEIQVYSARGPRWSVSRMTPLMRFSSTGPYPAECDAAKQLCASYETRTT